MRTKKKKPVIFGSLIMSGALILISGCNDSAPPESLISQDTAAGEAADEEVQTTNYLISIYKEPQGDLFTLRKPDHSIIASKITEAELMRRYPQAFDELALHGVSDDLNERIYYDGNQQRIRETEFRKP